MTAPDIIAQWRQAVEANEEVARTETDPERLTQHVEAARYCRDMVAKLESGWDGADSGPRQTDDEQKG